MQGVRQYLTPCITRALRADMQGVRDCCDVQGVRDSSLLCYMVPSIHSVTAYQMCIKFYMCGWESCALERQ